MSTETEKQPEDRIKQRVGVNVLVSCNKMCLKCKFMIQYAQVGGDHVLNLCFADPEGVDLDGTQRFEEISQFVATDCHWFIAS